jgi:hypothetical protein
MGSSCSKGTAHGQALLGRSATTRVETQLFVGRPGLGRRHPDTPPTSARRSWPAWLPGSLNNHHGAPSAGSRI